jgi:hypothetical protein
MDGTRGALSVGRQRELKDGTPGYVRCRPTAAAVGLDNGAADRQPHTQAVGLSRIVGVEEVLETLRIQPRPESRAATSTSSESSFPEPTSTSRGPSLTSLIASMALMI